MARNLEKALKGTNKVGAVTSETCNAFNQL